MSSTHRVFEILELVNEILSSLAPAQLALTARVNRDWFFLSLPNLWRSMCVRHAFAPLCVTGVPKNSWREPPTPAQWDRFLMYSKYVQVIIGCGYDISIVLNATRSRPSSVAYFFPNLRSLEWHTILMHNLPELALLIPPSLENINLSLVHVPLSSFKHLCEILINQLKALQFLQLGFDSPTQDRTEYVASFNQILKTCRSTLTHVQMPEECMTEETIRELRQLPKLRDVAIGTSFDLYLDDYYSVGKKWSYDVKHDGKEEDNFGGLENLLFTGSQQTFADLLLNRFTLPSLTVINWYRCMKLENPISFVTTISTVCPQLKTLTLGDSEMFTREGPLPPIIPWSIIRILLNCKLLTGLSLHCCRVSMTPVELIELLTSRQDSMPTRWEVLEVYTADPLSISDFLLFLNYCPRIHTLGVHLDGRHIEPVKHKGSSGPRFDSIAVIDFAYSPLDSNLIPDLAFFLLGVCEHKPIVCGWAWEDVGAYIWDVPRYD